MALCLTLCEPMDCSPPGSSVHGILQATILEWIAISFSRGSSPLRDWTWVSLVAGRFFTLPSGKSNIRMLSTVNQGRSVYRLPSSFSSFKNTKVKVKLLSHVQIFVIPWTVAYQAPLSMGFSRQECWSGLPFPSLGDLPNPGIECGSPALQADALASEPPRKLKTPDKNHLAEAQNSVNSWELILKHKNIHLENYQLVANS